ncbi:hypothetical protein ABFY60_10115 [Lysinibacillus pakistanensis]|uniref:hypothetical protein n=1 Tax=Lysinibacillus pakistanensis TaxID=759811 RepID=UPI003D2D424E
MEKNGGMRKANEEKDPIHRVKQQYLNSLRKLDRPSQLDDQSSLKKPSVLEIL